MNRQRPTRTRRRFLKTTGVGSLGVLTTIAGCSSEGDGGDGDGGEGDGGDGGPTTSGDGGSTTSQELQEVNITLPAWGFQGIMMDHIVDDTNILADKMESAGYKANVQKSWEGAALFASGGPDFSTMSSFAASRLGVERSQDLAVVARIAPLFMGWWAAKGGEYDPANTGSTQASMDALVENSATTAVGSWAGGDVPSYTITIDSQYGYTFTEEDNDFNTVTADYFAIPQLMMEGEVAAGGTSPIHGVSRHLDDNGDPQHVELFQCAQVLEDVGIGVPTLYSLTTTQEFVSNNRGAAQAYVQAWYEGMQWLNEDPMGRVMEDQSAHFQQLGVETEAQAQYLVDWGVNLSLDNEFPYNYADVELTDSAIEEDRNFLQTAAERGFIPENWSDRVEFVTIPQEA